MNTPALDASAPIRIVLVDDHRSVLWGLSKLIESSARMQLVATATNRREALEAVQAHAPNVVVLDFDLGDESALEVMGDLRGREAKVIVLTGVRDPQMREQAVLAGARGLVHKSEPAEVILDAIASVHEGELWLDRATLGRVFASLSAGRAAAAPREPLTPAERRVIAAVVKHKSAPNKVIANALCISAHTLRNHLASIYDKLGVPRRLDLVLYALEHELDRAPL
jgi:two-component system, NarL family, nitrate/nitrite response regulator NarL